MTTINVVIISVTILVCIIGILAVFYKISKRKYDQNALELEIKKYEFFGSISTENVEKEIDRLVDKYFNYYTLYNFQVHQKQYIKKDEMEKGVRDITKNIVIEMSELYAFYFRLLYNIETEEHLTSKIYELVTDRMIAYAAEYNRPKEE